MPYVAWPRWLHFGSTTTSNTITLILIFHLPISSHSVSHVGPGIHPGGGGSSHVDAAGASDGVHGTSTSRRKGDGGRQQRQQSKTAREQKGRRAAFLPGENTVRAGKGMPFLPKSCTHPRSHFVNPSFPFQPNQQQQQQQASSSSSAMWAKKNKESDVIEVRANKGQSKGLPLHSPSSSNFLTPPLLPSFSLTKGGRHRERIPAQRQVSRRTHGHQGHHRLLHLRENAQELCACPSRRPRQGRALSLRLDPWPHHLPLPRPREGPSRFPSIPYS